MAQNVLIKNVLLFKLIFHLRSYKTTKSNQFIYSLFSVEIVRMDLLTLSDEISEIDTRYDQI